MKISKLLTLVVSVFLVLAGCSGGKSTSSEESSSNGKVKISFINGFTGGDGAYMKKITDAFNASQDKYEVTELQEKDHYTKFKSGNYDLVVIHGNNLETYKQDGLIQDIQPVLDKAGIKESDFHQAGLDIVKLNGGDMFAVPLDIHPLTMFYNKEFVKEAPKTYQDLVSINSTLHAKNKDLYSLGIPSSGLVEFYMLMIAAQNGIELKDGGNLNFAQPKFADALMKFHDIVWKDHVSPPGLGLDGEFQTFMKEAKEGKAYQSAVAITGPWFYGAAKEKYGDNLGVAPIPQFGSKLAAYGNAHTIALSSKVKDQKVLDGISAYLKFMFTPENLINWAEGGQAPVHLPTLEKIKADPEKYQIAYQNSKQFEHYVSPPQVYQFGEQMRYMNETVFGKLVKTEKFTKKDLMKELEKATKMAKQIADTAPKK